MLLDLAFMLHRRHAVTEANQGRPHLPEVGRIGGNLQAGQAVPQEEQGPCLLLQQLDAGLVLGQQRPLTADHLLQVTSGLQTQPLIELTDLGPEFAVVLLAPQPQGFFPQMQR